MTSISYDFEPYLTISNHILGLRTLSFRTLNTVSYSIERSVTASNVTVSPSLTASSNALTESNQAVSLRAVTLQWCCSAMVFEWMFDEMAECSSECSECSTECSNVPVNVLVCTQPVEHARTFVLTFVLTFVGTFVGTFRFQRSQVIYLCRNWANFSNSAIE